MAKRLVALAEILGRSRNRLRSWQLANKILQVELMRALERAERENPGGLDSNERERTVQQTLEVIYALLLVNEH